VGTIGVGSLPVVADVVVAWLVPALLVVLVLFAAVVGIRWARDEHLDTLRAVPLFSLLSERQLRAVLRSARAVGFSPGTRLMSAGEPGRALFVISEGTASVTLDDGTEVASLGPGSYVGEMAVIDGKPRTATITASHARRRIRSSLIAARIRLGTAGR